jgi:hypothetical protein
VVFIKKHVEVLESETQEDLVCVTKEEYAVEVMREHHIKVSKEIIDCLAYDLW